MSVEYIGPFEHHHVIVTGHRVPYLEATPGIGGRIHLTLDRRFGLDLSLADAEWIVPFIAHCIAVAMGYTGFPEQDMARPYPPNPLPRVHSISSVEITEEEGTHPS